MLESKMEYDCSTLISKCQCYFQIIFTQNNVVVDSRFGSKSLKSKGVRLGGQKITSEFWKTPAL